MYIWVSIFIISILRMLILFVSTSVMYLLGFLLPPVAVIMLLLLFLVMRSPPPTVAVQIHFVAVAPDVPAAGRDDQMQRQEPNDEQNDAEVAEWETPVQETSQRTRSVIVVGTVTAPDLPAEDQGHEEPNDDIEDGECWRTPVQETPRTP